VLFLFKHSGVSWEVYGNISIGLVQYFFSIVTVIPTRSLWLWQVVSWRSGLLLPVCSIPVFTK
ncbi:unnamed protein product, partial [Bubo scandiacus]